MENNKEEVGVKEEDAQRPQFVSKEEIYKQSKII